MAVIANLDINLGARTAGLERGLTRAQSRVQGFTSAVGAASAKMQGFVAQAGLMILATIGITKALGGIKQAFQDIDATEKLAARIGADANKIRGLQLAAEKTGSSTSQLNKGLEVLQKRLGEVTALGKGEAKDALDALGLSSAELQRMAPTEQFKLIADRMQTLKTQSEKNAVAAALFSRANQGLVNTLDLTAAGLEREAAIAEKLGFSISKIDGERIQQTNDSMTQLKFAMKGAAIQTAILVAGPLKDFADSLTHIVTIATQVRKQLEDMIPERLVQVIDRLGLFKSPLSNVFRGLEKAGIIEPIDSAIFRPNAIVDPNAAESGGI